jgi:hypothetical protein
MSYLFAPHGLGMAVADTIFLSWYISSGLGQILEPGKKGQKERSKDKIYTDDSNTRIRGMQIKMHVPKELDVVSFSPRIVGRNQAFMNEAKMVPYIKENLSSSGQLQMIQVGKSGPCGPVSGI